MNDPLVSIGLPVFNGEKWVEQSIQSLVDQSCPNTEIIIADDCSFDSTSEICTQFANLLVLKRF